MEFSEMFNSTGNMLFYGGLIVMAISILIMILFAIISSSDKKRIERKIEKEFDNKE